ncbi:MAG: hypothetical protein KBD37_09915 [Burkholderiales bacterium]|nr:hypothetical protein [Burkholderiales bacterium]
MSKIINSIRRCFTQIPNSIIIDLSLSDGALRVFLYMSTKPDDWQFNNRDIQNKLNIKRAETIAKYWKELTQSGWVSRQSIINANGKPSGYFDYVLNFEPIRPTPQNAEVGTTDNPHTVNQQLRKNRSYTNKEKGTNNKRTNTPYTPQAEIKTNDSGIAGVWLEHIKNLNCNFSDTEISAIADFANYKASTGESVTSQQINLTLEILLEHKESGYDICRMIKHSIASGYKAVMTPTKDFLIVGVSKPNQTKGKYPALEYITPESNTQKRELANYLENCYLRKLNPKTKSPLNADELACIASHKSRQSKSSPYVGWYDYIYRYEVLTGVCLLDQLLGGADASTKSVTA